MDTWNLIQHWDLVLPPSRPSQAQLNWVASRVGGIDRSLAVGVLGCTPEYRDLLHECGFQNIYVLEKNINFFSAMSEARIYRNQEHLISGDWFDTLSEHKGIFAAILSDLTSGNVPYDKRRSFYRLIADALMADGVFLDKVLTHRGQNLSIESLTEKYSHLPMNLLSVNYFSCEMLFCSELLDITQLVDTSRFYSILDNRISNTRVRTFVDRSKVITPPGCIWWYGRKWDDLQSDYCPDLKLMTIEDDVPSSPYYSRLKFFTHTKGS